ncbi:MAG: hypothetical protein CME63_14790 [Halobacteriovoraceae bacterium]|nr:hypothetical protein [Halobacteriovoraceae bacterium]
MKSSTLRKQPILLIGFNRPNHIEQVFAKIMEYKPTHFYLAVDGARNEEEDQVVKKVQSITERVNWNCEVKTFFQKENLGCKRAVSTAITWFFEYEEQGIILEDDCVPDLSFFDFCSFNLDHFRNDYRIGMVAGCNLGANFDSEESFFFSYYISIWGWATWRRAWKFYDVNGDLIENDHMRRTMKRHFSWNELIYRTKCFKAVQLGEIDTWDYQWHLTCLSQNFLTIVPRLNLVSNIGVGEEATHTKDSRNLNFDKYSMSAPYKAPKYIIFNDQYDLSHEGTSRNFFKWLLNKGKTWLGK